MVKKTRKNYEKCLLLLCGILFCISLNLFIFSLPGIGVGFWQQSELSIIALHSISASLCLIFALLVRYKHNYTKLIIHPFTIPLFLIGFVSLILSPFYQLPLKNLLGSAHLGQGVTWWFDWAILTAAAIILMRFQFWRRVIIATAILSFFITYAMTVSKFWGLNKITPFHFPDFHAFHLICFLPIFIAFLQKTKAGLIKWLLFLFVFSFFMYHSNNNAGVAYILFGVSFFLSIWYVFPLSEAKRFLISALGLAAVPILALAVLIGFAHISSDLGYYSFVGQTQIINIVARAYLVEVVFHPLLKDITLFLTGHGWGTFYELITYNLPSEWVDFTRHGGQQWDGIRTDHFHSHNDFMEVLYSSGIAAFILYYLFFVVLAVRAPKSLRLPALMFSGGLVSLLSLWFMLPLNIPFIAMAAGFIAKRYDPKLKKIYALNYRYALGVLGVILTTQLVTLAPAIAIAQNGHKYHAVSLEVKDNTVACTLDVDDYGAGGHHLSKMIINRLNIAHALREDMDVAEDREQKVKLIKKTLGAVNNLFCQASLYQDKYESSIRLKIGQNIVRSELLILYAAYMSEEAQDYYYKDWESALTEWLNSYPSRTDQAVSFLQWHLIRNKNAEIKRIAELIYALDHHDPIGLWFRGLGMLNAPQTSAQGLQFLRRALDNGIERFMPVEEDIKTQLGYTQ